MRFSGLLLIGALALGACGKETKPKLDENDLPRIAAEYVAVYNDWDGERLKGLYGKKKPNLDKEQARLGWLRETLGACGEPQLMWKLDLTYGRFNTPCERGSFEFWMRLDGKGRLKGALNGAVGVATPAPLAAAVDEVLAAMPWAKAGAGEQPWGKALKAGWVRKLGRCELASVRSVNSFSGRFDLRCEHGTAFMKVTLGEDGKISRVQLWPSTHDRTRAFEGEMMG